jgi:hypothetical protein
MLCAAAMAARSFRGCNLPCKTKPAGDVVVFAPRGVALERWMPVFMYAWLS